MMDSSDVGADVTSIGCGERGANVKVGTGAAAVGGAESLRISASCCVEGSGVWLSLCSSGDEAGSFLSTSSSLSIDCEMPSRSNLSVAHRRICQPSPSPTPMFRLSRKIRRSSRQSWYPSLRAFVCAAAEVLYSFVTDRAAARKTSRSCSGDSLPPGFFVGEAPLMPSIVGGFGACRMLAVVRKGCLWCSMVRVSIFLGVCRLDSSCVPR